VVFAASVVLAGAVKVFTALDVRLLGLVSVATRTPGFVPVPWRIATAVLLPTVWRNGSSTVESV